MTAATTAKPITVMVTDDHEVVRRGIVSLLREDGAFAVVAEADSGEEAVRLFRLHQPDVTLMDLQMPGIGGLEAIRRIRVFGPSSRLIVLTTYEGDEDIHQALQAGAIGYLLKNMPAAQIKDAIRSAHAGVRTLPEVVSRKLRGRAEELSRRELDVLRLIAQGKSNKEIAEALGLLESTVKTHVLNVLAKLGVADRTGAAIAAVKRGIVHL
jgi:two-component system NarL family response regulator